MATAKYDLERLMGDLEAFIKAKLNTQLSVIDAEKADSVTLVPIDNDAYFPLWMGDRVANFNPLVSFGITDERVNSVGAASVRVLTVYVFVLLTDSMNDLDILKRLYRYQRGLFDIFEKDWMSVGRGVDLKITGLLPFVASLLQVQNSHRGIGIQLEIALG